MIAYAGMFETRDKAQAAADALEGGLFAGRVVMVDADKLTSLTAADKEILEGVFSRVTEAVKAGHFAVAVNAQLFRGQYAEEALEEHGAAKVVYGSGESSDHITDGMGFPILSTARPKSHTGTKMKHVFDFALAATPKAGRKSSLGLPLLLSSHITPTLVTGDKTHMTGFIPLLTPRKKTD
jgi:hypothetical protein